MERVWFWKAPIEIRWCLLHFQIRKRMEKSAGNRQSLYAIDSSFVICFLDDDHVPIDVSPFFSMHDVIHVHPNNLFPLPTCCVGYFSHFLLSEGNR